MRFQNGSNIVATELRIMQFWSDIILVISDLIIYMKKLLDSDWLGAVQFKCNTSAKSVTPVQITHRNSGLRLTERQKEIF